MKLLEWFTTARKVVSFNSILIRTGSIEFGGKNLTVTAAIAIGNLNDMKSNEIMTNITLIRTSFFELKFAELLLLRTFLFLN